MVLRTAERITLECDQRHSSLFIAVDNEVFENHSLYLASHRRCDITHNQNRPLESMKSADRRRFLSALCGGGSLGVGEKWLNCGR